MILDTNALSAFVGGDAGVGEVLRRQARVAIPVIVLGEFRCGIAQSRHRPAYEAWLESQLTHFEVLSIAEETTIAYAAVRLALRQLGRPIPANDVWIAALALQHRLPVLSRDHHFDAAQRNHAARCDCRLRAEDFRIGDQIVTVLVVAAIAHVAPHLVQQSGHVQQ